MTEQRAHSDELIHVNAAIKRHQRMLGTLFVRRYQLGGGSAKSSVKGHKIAMTISGTETTSSGKCRLPKRKPRQL